MHCREKQSPNKNKYKNCFTLMRKYLTPKRMQYFHKSPKTKMYSLRRNPLRKIRKATYENPLSRKVGNKTHKKKGWKSKIKDLNEDCLSFLIDESSRNSSFSVYPHNESCVQDHTNGLECNSSKQRSTNNAESKYDSSPVKKRRRISKSPDILQDSVIIISDIHEDKNSANKTLNNNDSEVIEVDCPILPQKTFSDKDQIKDVLQDLQSNVNSCHTQKSVKKKKSGSHSSINSTTTLNNESVIIIEDDNEVFKEPESSKAVTSQDDIAVVWTSLPEASCSKTANEYPYPLHKSNNINESNNSSDNGIQSQEFQFQKKLFYEDVTPCPSNLKCLVPEKERHRKKNKYLSKYTDENTGNNVHKSNKRKRVVREKSPEKITEIAECAINKNNENSNRKPDGKLREIVVDGCNVGNAYTHNKGFSETGIKLIVDYFQQKGHIVKVFLPQHKRSRSRQLLENMFKDGTVVFTPSRNIAGKKITSYDDKYILEYATLCEGIVVSLDQYRDLYEEKPEWRHTIVNRLLQPTFVGNYVMFPDDPLGKNGPKLDEFLRH